MFYERVFGVKHLTLLNYAGTAFIAGIHVANYYTGSEVLRQWFEKQIIDGKISATVILTNPRSYAAKDAEKYKMYPDKRKCEQEEIIRMNLGTLLDFRKKYPKADLQVYVTDIALPYGIMLAENYEDPVHNYMKIDIYAPVILSDSKRPSFFLTNCANETREMYDFFLGNLETIREYHSSPVGELLSIDWLKEKPIVCGGGNDAKAHIYGACRGCFMSGNPMEVDLLEMKDGELLVCGDMTVRAKYGTRMLSQYSTKELYEMLNEEEIAGEEAVLLSGVMTFREFLRYVDGRVGLLVKVTDYAENSDDLYHAELARKVVSAVNDYCGKIAVQSENPYVLREIRKIDRMIPIGQISSDYHEGNEVGADFRQLHLQTGYTDIVEPDFINYEIGALARDEGLRDTVRRICKDRNIPLFVWTVRNKKEKRIAQTVCGCDNYVTEGPDAF